MTEEDTYGAVLADWRKICRTLARREESYPNSICFSSPNVMMAFTKDANALPDLKAKVPAEVEALRVKNREARLHYPTSIIRPTDIEHIRHCVEWALRHRFSLTVVGGGHSGHCLWSNVVAVDMTAFDHLHIIKPRELRGHGSGDSSGTLVVVGAGCKVGDIVRKTMAEGLTVPLGSRPSVGAGLWLQGGIGHLARLHGLACDAILGAVIVSVASGQLLLVGHVPDQHQPVGAVRPQDEMDLLWAIRGAGTNFGIVVSVVFKTYAAPTYHIRNWLVPLNDNLEAQQRLGQFNERVVRASSRNRSADAYLYWDSGKLRLGVTMLETSIPSDESQISAANSLSTFLGPEDKSKSVNSVELFETEMYISEMHGGHGGGKTSSFKRCLFLKSIGAVDVVNVLVAAMETRPTPLCYLHLLQGGGAVADVQDEDTAFGCRDWDFACVITGVWSRDKDETENARIVTLWVYKVAEDLLPLSSGVYGADLGPDPRDASLAMKAFGHNRPRLAQLKRSYDPNDVLAYACPLPKAPSGPKLIVLVTGESCVGKDYCANIWVSMFKACSRETMNARTVSISDATKKEYAAHTGADLELLLSDRAYKEKHRPALSKFFQDQVRQRPQLPEEHFLNVIHAARDVNVLLITGMRDEAPVAAFSHLVPTSRLLEVKVKASKKTQEARRGCQTSDSDESEKNQSPSCIFSNEASGDEAIQDFFERHLRPLLHDDLRRLASMVRTIPNFPCAGIDFRHVLDISQQPGGLVLCTSLLERHFRGDWDKVDAVATCEVGGFVYASALAAQVNVPLMLIREAGKLPQPTFSVRKSPSHISHSACIDLGDKRIEMGQGLVRRGASIVVVDDVLATGETLHAILRLLEVAGVSAGDVSVMVVAEFPVHRGREMLRRHGFGATHIQSLLSFGGA